MNRRSMSVIPAVVALCLTNSSLANAAEATYPAGTRAPVGQEISLTGKNVVLKSTSLGKLICETLNLNAKITVNNGITVTTSGNNTNPTQAGCYNIDKTRPFTITNVNITQLLFKEANGPSGALKAGTLSFTMTVDFPSEIICKLTANNLPVKYVSAASPAVLTSTDTGGHITSTGGCGNYTLEGSFTLHGPVGSTSPALLH